MRVILPFDSFRNKFNVQYYSILSSIPQNWKKLLQESSKDPDTPPTSICSLPCKAIYSILPNLEGLPPPTSEKKLLASGVEKSDLNKVQPLFILGSVYSTSASGPEQTIETNNSNTT